MTAEGLHWLLRLTGLPMEAFGGHLLRDREIGLRTPTRTTSYGSDHRCGLEVTSGELERAPFEFGHVKGNSRTSLLTHGLSPFLFVASQVGPAAEALARDDGETEEVEGGVRAHLRSRRSPACPIQSSNPIESR